MLRIIKPPLVLAKAIGGIVIEGNVIIAGHVSINGHHRIPVDNEMLSFDIFRRENKDEVYAPRAGVRDKPAEECHVAAVDVLGIVPEQRPGGVKISVPGLIDGGKAFIPVGGGRPDKRF